MNTVDTVDIAAEIEAFHNSISKTAASLGCTVDEMTCWPMYSNRSYTYAEYVAYLSTP